MKHKLLLFSLLILLSTCFFPILLAEEAEETPSTPPVPTTDERLAKEIANYIDQLLGDNAIVVERSRNELLELGHQAVPQLIQALSHEKSELRYLACEILVELRDERTLPDLLILLQDKEEAGMSIRAIATRALGRLGNASVIPALIPALKSTDVDLRYETLRALATLRAYKAIPQISKLISDTALTFYDREIRCGAIEALGRLKARIKIQKLVDLLTIKDVEPAAERAVVEYVIVALECITGETMGFIPLEDGPKRDELIKKWQLWWDEHKDEYTKPEESKESEKKPEPSSTEEPTATPKTPAAEGEPHQKQEKPEKEKE